MTQQNNWEAYILQYMGDDNTYVKATEASAYIYIPEIKSNSNGFDKSNIRLELKQIVDKIRSVKSDAEYHFDFRSLLYKSFTTDLVINKLDGKSELNVKHDDSFWYIETPNPLESNNSHYIFKWTIRKKDSTLLRAETLVEGKKSSNSYIFDFITNEEGTHLYKASHNQIIKKGKKIYSGGLEIYVVPTNENFSSITSMGGNHYDFSKNNNKINASPETLDDFKIRLNVPDIKFN